MKFWTAFGKVKQVLSQLSLYFAGVSMLGILITAWHTTISPILVSCGITPSPWWLIFGLGAPFLVLGVMEWMKGTPGYFNSFMKLFYTKDSELKKDIDELKKEMKEIKKILKEDK